MVSIVNWNIGHRLAPLDDLLKMDAGVALFQEVPVGAVGNCRVPEARSR